MKGVLSSKTGVEVDKLQWEKAILDFEVGKLFFADEIMIESLADRTA